MPDRSLFSLSDIQLGAIARWCTVNHTGWPLYGRLWAWLLLVDWRLDPEDARDRAEFVWLREAVATRIVDDALDDAGWSFEQLALDGVITDEATGVLQ